MGAFSNEVEQAILEASRESALPLSYMRVMAYIESAGNPNAYNRGSGAAGLYQFIPSTARFYGLLDPYNPRLAAKAAAALTKANLAHLRSRGYTINLIETPSIGYLAHQQGAGGLVAILTAIKNKTAVSATIRRNMDSNKGRGKSPLEFVKYWENYYYEKAKILQALDEDN